MATKRQKKKEIIKEKTKDEGIGIVRRNKKHRKSI
jgi:hypothetical protein